MKALTGVLSCFNRKEKARVENGSIEDNEPIADWLMQSREESRSAVKAKARRRSKRRAKWL